MEDWKDLLQPKLEGRIAWTNSPCEFVGAALQTLGMHFNSTATDLKAAGVSEVDLAAAVARLRRQVSQLAYWCKGQLNWTQPKAHMGPKLEVCVMRLQAHAVVDLPSQALLPQAVVVHALAPPPGLLDWTSQLRCRCVCSAAESTQGRCQQMTCGRWWAGVVTSSPWQSASTMLCWWLPHQAQLCGQTCGLSHHKHAMALR